MKKCFLFVSLLTILLTGCSKSGVIDEVISDSALLNKETEVYSNLPAHSRVFVDTPIDVYPMQIIKKSTVQQKGSYQELNAEARPHSLIFDFLPTPYVANIDNPNGSLTFKKAVSVAMKSKEWDTYTKSKVSKSQYLSYGIFSSVDKAKAFIGEPSLYSILDNAKFKYIFVAKVFVSSFDVNTEVKGVAADADDACYVSSLTYGRYAYLAIHTNESPEKVIDLFVNGVLKRNASYDNVYTKIATSINIVEKGSSYNGSYWGTAESFYALMDIFNINAISVGVPILFQLKDVQTKEVI